MKADAYFGLTKKAAQNKAEAENKVFRLVSIGDEKYLGEPEDGPRTDRVCVKLDKDSKVIEAEYR